SGPERRYGMSAIRTCPLCGLRFDNPPILELHIREDHRRRGRGAAPAGGRAAAPGPPRAPRPPGGGRRTGAARPPAPPPPPAAGAGRQMWAMPANGPGQLAIVYGSVTGPFLGEPRL